ncbi:MAG: hypothetical protein P8Y46_01750 [Sulfurovaceae bacterium]
MNQFTHKLYTLLERDGDNYRIQLADASHPLFQAHFKNNPILPAKFKDIIQPLDKITIVIKREDSKLKVIFQKENKTASEMSLETR